MRKRAPKKAIAPTPTAASPRVTGCALLFRDLCAMPAKDTGKTSKEGGSGAKSLCGPGFCFGRFLFPISWRGMGLERPKKPGRDSRNLLDRGVKCGFVCLGRFVEAAYFPYV